MSSVQEEKAATDSQAKTHVRDIRNTELVSRLLAATPPYLYSALPLQPHAFFFSEMLRSFVNARQGCRPPHYHRRFKRRTHKYYAENENEWRREWPKQDEEKKEPEVRPEVPLELTVEKHQRMRDHSPRRSPKTERAKPSGSPGPPGRQSSYVDVGTEELPKPSPCVSRNSENSIPPSNLILPPPPPMWYPPIYNPQFGVDPLNFFIDLRVSGHIYDRKRAVGEGVETNQERTEDSLDKRVGKEFGRPRHLSAFSVPVRSGNSENVEFQESNKLDNVNGTSYIMKNLKGVYENLNSSRHMKDILKKSDEAKAEISDVDDEIVE